MRLSIRTPERSEIDSRRKHKSLKSDSHRFAVAPMMEWTDRHCRYFLRLISKRTFLYTEMVTAEAVLHGDRERVLGFDAAEHPVALQLGGSDRQEARARRRGSAPSTAMTRSTSMSAARRTACSRGGFGACLMAEPELVGECVAAMDASSGLPVTVKCRIGIDDQDAEESLDRFIDEVSRAGCTTFIVHARKAWLQGLSPKQNRDVPPLDYGRVYRLKERTARARDHHQWRDRVFRRGEGSVGACRRRDARPRRLCRSLSSRRGGWRAVRRGGGAVRRGSMCSMPSGLMSRPSLRAGAASIR